MTSKGWRKLYEFDTEFSADSTEWCPFEPYQHVFVCGTYQLNKQDVSQKRCGKIFLLKIENGLKVLQTIDCPAVLDIKWAKHKIECKILLGVVNAIGDVTVFNFSDYRLDLIANINLKPGSFSNDFLALSLDWSNEPNGRDICVSDSQGCGHVVRMLDSHLESKQSWKAHTLEAWIISYNSCFNDIIYTGGDDCKLKIWDLRSGTVNSQFTSNSHQAGVTTLHCSDKKRLVASGSYDEYIILWDIRNWKSQVNRIKASGGLWRLKWEPRNHDYLLSACIYGGFQIINGSSCEVLADYKEHESLAYGADWCYLNSKEASELLNTYSDNFVIATCSFYDHKLTVSLWNEFNVT